MITLLDRSDDVLKHATATLYATVFQEPPWNEAWSIISALEVLNDPLLIWWIEHTSNDVQGFVSGCAGQALEVCDHFHLPIELTRGRKIGYKSELGVAPGLRRSGLAKRLTMELLSFFREEKIEQFLVRTRPGTGNHPWYSRRLERLYEYPDGRVIFGAPGVPTL